MDEDSEQPLSTTRDLLTLRGVTSEFAATLIDAAQQDARSRGVEVTIAVCDAGGHLIALSRMNGALLASLEVAQVKARTAVFFGTETCNLPFDKPFTPALLGGVSYPVAFLPGGVPIRANGRIVGGIGVGGGTGEQDQALASAALRSWPS